MNPSICTMDGTFHKAFSKRAARGRLALLERGPGRQKRQGRDSSARRAGSHLGPWIRPGPAPPGTAPASPPAGAAPASAPAGCGPPSPGMRLWRPPPQPLPWRSSKWGRVALKLLHRRGCMNPESIHANCVFLPNFKYPTLPSADYPQGGVHVISKAKGTTKTQKNAPFGANVQSDN